MFPHHAIRHLLQQQRELAQQAAAPESFEAFVARETLLEEARSANNAAQTLPAQTLRLFNSAPTTEVKTVYVEGPNGKVSSVGTKLENDPIESSGPM